MTIKTNQELADFVKKAIDASGMKKSVIAENIGLSRQGLDNLLKKQSFSLDDANRILKTIQIYAYTQIEINEEVPEYCIQKKLVDLVDDFRY